MEREIEDNLIQQHKRKIQMNSNTLTNEVWKTITEHKSYQVSNLGRVRSLNYKRKGETRILS